MKIYNILLDTYPEDPEMMSFLQQQGFHKVNHITNCFTLTSYMSMLTSEMPSDLEKDGIGYSTQERYWKENRAVKWPFADKYIMNILANNGWDIEIHLPEGGSIKDWFLFTVVNDDRYQITTIEDKEIVRQLSRNDNTFMQHVAKEKEYVRKMQKTKFDRDTFYLIKYSYLHSAIFHGKTNQFPLIKQQQLELMKTWNFEEEDALFWIFSDHDSWKNFDYRGQPNAFYRWAQIRDNTLQPLQIKSNYIAIGDFYNTILDKLDIDYDSNKESYSITCEQDQDRIYYMEDSRLAVELWKSTTFTSCQFIDWIDSIPNKLISVSFHMLNKTHYYYIMDLNTQKVEESIITPEHVLLRDALHKRFKLEEN